MGIIGAIQTSRILILGCGNVLLGDDGFGPAVIAQIKSESRFPPDVQAEDVGTSVREVLFDIALSEKRPDRLILVDTMNREGKKHGEIFEVDVHDLPEEKIADYSMHQFPTSNLLREIADLCGVRVTIIAAQQSAPAAAVTMELSEPMKNAVLAAAKMVSELCSGA